jgi:hypothetical protein
MKKRTLIYAALLLMAGSTVVSGQSIHTIAGTGIAGFSGDGGLAISAQFSLPSGVAVDLAGNIYVADKNNHRVRKIAAGTGIVATFSGNGGFGSCGLGGPAYSSCLEYPYGVFVNLTGDVMITDFFRDMTLNVDHTTGNIASRLGCGTQGNDGDGGDATMAKMMLPRNACQDLAGNTYIADGSWVRKVDAATGIASTVATMQAEGVFFDVTTTTDLYVSGGNMIKKINVSTGAITTIAGTGAAGYSGNGWLATAATFSNPGSMFIDAHRVLYVCDRGNNAVREINLTTGMVLSIAGNGIMGFSGDGGFSPLATLNDPEGVWVDAASNIYIADAGNQRIRMIIPKGAPGGGTFSSPKALNGFTTAAGDETSVYPNPSNGMFTLQAGTDQLNASFNVYNVIGQVVFSGTVSDAKTSIDLSTQAAGVYTLMLKSASGTYTQKLSKQ